MESFAAVAAHEMVHSTGHPSRLNRTFGTRDQIFGRPDAAYCMEELRAEIGSLFLLNDLQIPLKDVDQASAAAYVEAYMQAMSANPNILFRAAADAEKAEQYILKNLAKTMELQMVIDDIPDHMALKEPKKGKAAESGSPVSRNRFNNFHQRTYDYQKLEQALFQKQIIEQEPKEACQGTTDLQRHQTIGI